MGVKYSWSRQNGTNLPPNRFMAIEAEDYYKGMPLKLKEKGVVEPTDGDPQYICMAQYNPDDDVQPLEIPVQEVFPDVIYEKVNDDGTREEVQFGAKGGGGIKTVNGQAPDENGNVEVVAGVQSDMYETDPESMAFVKNNPLDVDYINEPLNITWDGNIDGKEISSQDGFINVKLSDAVLTTEQLVGTEYTILYTDTNETETYLIEESEIQDLSVMGLPALFADCSHCGFFVVFQDATINGYFMSAGFWWGYSEGYYPVSISNPNVIIEQDKTQLKPSLIPTHSHKWDDISDAPFYDKSTSEPLNITFDGDITGKEVVNIGAKYVKISDSFLSSDALIGSTVTIGNNDDSQDWSDTLVESDIEDQTDGDFALVYVKSIDGEGMDEPLIFSVNGDMTEAGLPFNTGVYVALIDATSDYEAGWVKSISNPNATISVSDIKKLDNKYIDAEWMATKIKKKEVILPEQTLDFSNGAVEITGSVSQTITAGSKYTVYLNEEVFECNANIFESDLYNGAVSCIGNLAVLGFDDSFDSGENFLVISVDTTLQTLIAVKDLESAVVKIEGEVTTYNKLPIEFLPPTISLQPVIYTNHTHSYIKDIAADLAAGHEVYISDDGDLYRVISADYDVIDGWDKVLMMNKNGIYYIDGWEDSSFDNSNAGKIRPLLITQHTTYIYMRSDDNRRYRLHIDSDGNLKTTEITS